MKWSVLPTREVTVKQVASMVVEADGPETARQGVLDTLVKGEWGHIKWVEIGVLTDHIAIDDEVEEHTGSDPDEIIFEVE
jgi:hypothetical protein